jgi:hypothetical protein
VPKRKEQVMQQLANVQRIMQHPLITVLGVRAGAAAAKSGQGAWVDAGILTYFSATLTFMAARSAAVRVGRVRRDEQAWCGESIQGEKQ